MSDRHAIEHYYERNTRRFLLFGGGRTAHAIHRQLWGPGVENREAAAGHINQLLEAALAEIGAADAPVLIDLGCGVGGTLLHLAGAFPRASLHGVTISRRQVEIGKAALKRAGVVGQVQLHCADFETLELGLEADAIIAVESFTHSRTADDFFQAASGHLKPGGTLILVDDLVRSGDGEPNAAEQRLIDDFRIGWRVPSLCRTSDCVDYAERRNFELVEQRDLTDLIRLGRPRDRLIALIAPVASALGLERMPFFGNLIGGNALHAGLGKGLFEYRWLSFRHSPPAHPDRARKSR